MANARVAELERLLDARDLPTVEDLRAMVRQRGLRVLHAGEDRVWWRAVLCDTEGATVFRPGVGPTLGDALLRALIQVERKAVWADSERASDEGVKLAFAAAQDEIPKSSPSATDSVAPRFDSLTRAVGDTDGEDLIG